MMRIGIMLRAFDEKGGISVYAQNIVKELLRIDEQNHYVLFYRNKAHLGRFAHHSNVTEKVVRGANKVYWDQLAIPLACWREKIDILFHPKFTAPLLAPCPVVMVVHGADWFIPEQARYYPPMDVWLTRRSMPLYFKKCRMVISVSQLTTDNFYEVLDLPPGKVQTVYFGPARHFQRVTDLAALAEVRACYSLPDGFILTLTKLQGDGRKNLSQIFKAYAHYHHVTEQPLKLVVGGKDCHRFREIYNLSDDGYGKDILFPGWIDQADLPAVYSQADLFLYPSNLEAFPIPITEAMACGTPIVTSNVNGLVEIAGEAAVFVNPHDSEAIAGAICRVLDDEALQERLSKKGLARSTQFSWERCAAETLAILESVVEARAKVYVH
jgi:glycosyltransferase involved in cell wall biosynthesis